MIGKWFSTLWETSMRDDPRRAVAAVVLLILSLYALIALFVALAALCLRIGMLSWPPLLVAVAGAIWRCVIIVFKEEGTS